MNIILWILQVLLAAQFLQHGIMMVFPPAEYVEIMNANMAVGLRYFIGIVEFLAVIGLLLPGILRIYTWLIPLTGVGLMLVIASATVLHFTRGETSSAVYTAVLFLIITYTTYMRWKVKPIFPGHGKHNSARKIFV
jgi:uncharacterized membrane protein YphA (DoxX/SURF4 family)